MNTYEGTPGGTNPFKRVEPYRAKNMAVLPAPVVELWCQNCEGHYGDGTPCRTKPDGYGCVRNSHWRRPRRLSCESDAAICRTIGHEVREEVRAPLAEDWNAGDGPARTLRERVEALAISECRRAQVHGPACPGAGPSQRPCLRESTYQCDPCVKVFRLAAEVGALEDAVELLKSPAPARAPLLDRAR